MRKEKFNVKNSLFYLNKFLLEKLKQKHVKKQKGVILRLNSLINKKDFLFPFNRLKMERHYIIHINSVYSNFYFVLTDINGHIVYNFTCGQVSPTRSKKMKISSITLYNLMKKLISVLIKNRIRNLIIFFKTDINAKLLNVFKLLKTFNFKISFIFFLKPIPHHIGRRKKKIRRL